MPRLSLELRETIIQLNENGHKPSAIVKLLPEKVDITSVYRLIFKYKITKTTRDLKRKQPSKITRAISDLIDEIFCNDR